MPAPTGLPQELNAKQNVKLGVLDCYVGAEDLAYTSATGWANTGVIDPDTFTTNATKNMFEFLSGFPETNKLMAIIGVSLEIDFTIREMTRLATELCVGSGDTAKSYTTVPAATTTTASSPTTTSFTLTSATGYAVNQLIEVGLSAGAIPAEDVYITAIAGAVVTVQPPLSVAPTAGDTVKGILTYSNAVGSEEVPRKAFKTVILDQWGEKVTLWVPAVSPVGPFSPKFSNAKTNAVLPVKLKAYGKAQTWNGKSQSVVGFLYRTMAGVS